ncbi:MAG: MobF family relaxase, partial [Xenococcaceae cyanobacterium]
GVDREKLNAAFSSRSNQIEAELSSRGLTRTTATAEQKQAVCLKTRQEKKRSSHPQDRQKQLLEWQQKARENRIEPSLPSEYHRDLVEQTPNNQNPARSIKELISNATFILTERSTAFLPHELLRECLRQSQGRYEPEKIQNQIALYQEFIPTRDGRLTTTETLSRVKLLQEAGLSSAIIDQNLRQRDPQLKQVVDLIANHEQNADSINQAYQKLNDRGKVKQITNDEVRRQEISSDYLSRPTQARNKTLILAGTNEDKRAIANIVRQGLMAEGTLGNESLNLQTLKRKDIDRFAITCAHHYQRGNVIKFQTDSARFSKNSYYRVTEIDPEAKSITLIDTLGLTETLPLNKYKQREIYTVQNQEIRPGERMRFTKNIRNSDHKQLNGQRFTVRSVTPDGQIEITSKGKTQKISDLRLLHCDYSYVDTVHSSQGQTADYCIYSAAIAQSKTIGRESFYVAASRAKQEFVVYTKNAVDLGVTIQLSRKKENAHELVQSLDLPKNQEKSQELDRQQTTKTKSEPTNQPPQLNDAELINSLNRLSQWQKESPKKPNGHYGQSKHQQIERFKQEKAQLEKRLKLQELELEKLGKPRSILNPFGVSADVIENKQIEIARTRSGIYDLESQLRYVLPDFQRWQKQARAYLAWDEEKSTKQMRQLEKDFSTPQIRQRVERLNDVYTVYAAASYIVNQQGTESANGRYYQGKSYRIEQQDKKVTITHRDRDELLMQATDCRERGGIIQVSQFNLTREDKNIIRDSARDLKQQIDQL